MKYFYIFLIFICGVVVGRWTSPKGEAGPVVSENYRPTDLAPRMAPEAQSAKVQGPLQTTDENSAPKGSSLAHKTSEDGPSFARTDDKMKDKKMTKLYDQLMEANRNDNTEEQNRLFAEMESLDPKHEKVFQAKVTFLQDDDDWEGAHKVLEECVGVIPSSAYCLKRLANIRSSTIDDRIRYGNECLQVAKDDPSCIVDLAIALRSKGELAKSKDYFEQALSLPSKGEGYDRPYVLYHYGFTLEELGLAQKSKAAFAESCRLHWKPACEKLKAS